MKNKQAFTLIELLVVVLVIGILAAVALPQYQKAVEKARYTHLVEAAESIYKSALAFKLENGYYTCNFDELSIDFPGITNFTTNNQGGKTKITFNGIQCMLSTSGADTESSYIICRHQASNLHYGRWLYNNAYVKEGARVCVSIGEEKDTFCQRETGKTYFTNGTWHVWAY